MKSGGAHCAWAYAVKVTKFGGVYFCNEEASINGFSFGKDTTTDMGKSPGAPFCKGGDKEPAASPSKGARGNTATGEQMLEVKLLAPPQTLRRTGNKYLYHPIKRRSWKNVACLPGCEGRWNNESSHGLQRYDFQKTSYSPFSSHTTLTPGTNFLFVPSGSQRLLRRHPCCRLAIRPAMAATVPSVLCEPQPLPEDV